jgi:hypothetical protein
MRDNLKFYFIIVNSSKLHFIEILCTVVNIEFIKILRVLCRLYYLNTHGFPGAICTREIVCVGFIKK